MVSKWVLTRANFVELENLPGFHSSTMRSGKDLRMKLSALANGFAIGLLQN